MTLPPGITRLDSDRYRVHGYRVRLQYRGGRPQIQSWFPDQRHGGKRAALAAAKAYIEEVGK